MPTFRALYIAATLSRSAMRRRSRYQRLSPLRRRSRKIRSTHVLDLARGMHPEACFCEMCLDTL